MERKSLESDSRELSAKLTEAVISKEEEAGRRIEVQEMNKELRMTIDKLRTQVFYQYYYFVTNSDKSLLISVSLHFFPSAIVFISKV